MDRAALLKDFVRKAESVQIVERELYALLQMEMMSFLGVILGYLMVLCFVHSSISLIVLVSGGRHGQVWDWQRQEEVLVVSA
jgi:hypothetical protein